MLRLNNSKIIDSLIMNVIEDVDGIKCVEEGRVTLSLRFNNERGVDIIVDRYSRVVEISFDNAALFTAPNFLHLSRVVEKIKSTALAHGF